MITERTRDRTRVPARYRLLEEVGQGGMAVVYRAQDESLKREVAIKVLHPHLWAERESKARLEREAQAVAKLKHDNILEIFDYSGSDAESAYIVTEFIDGQTLKQFLKSYQPRRAEFGALLAAELAGALAHAHRLGIIHRDVKPENVMIRKDGILKLMDFGIAQVLDMERMTVTGQLLGSPAYMAPELIEGRPLDVRTDVFSVGILLYQVVTGLLPFSGKNPHEVLRRISEGKFANPQTINRLCGAGLCRIMARALAHNPDDRYPGMDELARDLRADLAEAGLFDVRAELCLFFGAPERYETELPARMTPALTASARSHLTANQSGDADCGKAIECWNRVLAYDPDNIEVLSALKRLHGRTLLRTVGQYGAIAAAVLVVLAAIVFGVIHRGAPSSSSSSTGSLGPGLSSEATPAGLPGGLPVASGDQPHPSSALGPAQIHSPTTMPEGGERELEARPAVASHPLRPRSVPGDHPGGPGRLDATGAQSPGDEDPATVPSPSPSGLAAGDGQTRVFRLGPTPQNVDVYLDGQRQFSYDTDHRTLPVPWVGNHVVEFRSPSECCFVERVELGPDRPVPADNIIARQLKWKPARLIVTTTPPAPAKTRVMVRDPAHAGRGTVVEPGEEANIAFFSTDEGQKEVEVSVDSDGVFSAERVTVRAGERKSVVLPLGTAP
ncbi:MAG: protein kinase [Polyangia bacterium]